MLTGTEPFRSALSTQLNTKPYYLEISQLKKRNAKKNVYFLPLCFKLAQYIGSTLPANMLGVVAVDFVVALRLHRLIHSDE